MLHTRISLYLFTCSSQTVYWTYFQSSLSYSHISNIDTWKSSRLINIIPKYATNISSPVRYNLLIKSTWKRLISCIPFYIILLNDVLHKIILLSVSLRKLHGSLDDLLSKSAPYCLNWRYMSLSIYSKVASRFSRSLMHASSANVMVGVLLNLETRKIPQQEVRVYSLFISESSIFIEEFTLLNI